MIQSHSCYRYTIPQGGHARTHSTTNSAPEKPSAEVGRLSALWLRERGMRENARDTKREALARSAMRDDEGWSMKGRVALSADFGWHAFTRGHPASRGRPRVGMFLHSGRAMTSQFCGGHVLGPSTSAPCSPLSQTTNSANSPSRAMKTANGSAHCKQCKRLSACKARQNRRRNASAFSGVRRLFCGFWP